MAADTYMSICIHCGLSLETKTTMQGDNVKEVMGTDEGGDCSSLISPWNVFVAQCFTCMLVLEGVLVICVVCVSVYSWSSLYQCHGGCQANECGLSLEQEGLGCAIHSAYLNAL